MRHYVIIM